MAKRFLDKKTHRFYFIDSDGERKSYVLIYGDEIDTMTSAAPSGVGWQKIKYRGRTGEMKSQPLSESRALEMYFLDVGQGDAAFVVTPGGKKILIDGGLRRRALDFLVWKYRLDKPDSSVTIDFLILSHADADHLEGFVPILTHPQITVLNIRHNGIAVFDSGFNSELGDIDNAGRLTTIHDTTADLAGLNLDPDFQSWINAVDASGADHRAIDASIGILNIGDPSITVEVLGPIREVGGDTLKWFGGQSGKGKTINGHSVVLRLIYEDVRILFTGDLNKHGSKHLLANQPVASTYDAHVLKSPHHGSKDYHQTLFNAIRPMITVVSSGDSPDHGHPRAQFIGGIGLAGRSQKPLVFSTEIAATFVDAGEAAAAAAGPDPVLTAAGELDYSKAETNEYARRLFKKSLPGIINVRTDGEKIYAARRVAASYQWESYGGIDPI